MSTRLNLFSCFVGMTLIKVLYSIAPFGSFGITSLASALRGRGMYTSLVNLTIPSSRA